MHGIHTALTTPFLADGSLDLDSFRRACERQVAAGIHGLVPCGTTGETPTLSADEQRLLWEVAGEAANGLPITVGVGTNATSSTVANVQAAKAAGVTQGLLVFPYYNKPNPDGLRAHVKAALEPGLPIVLYHVPGRTGQMVSADLVAELSELPGVVAVKEATGDIKYGGDLITQTDTPILSGDDFSFLQLMAMGGEGCVSVVSNVDPARTVAIYDAFRSGDMSTAIALHHELWELITFLFSDANPVPAKAAMSALGLGAAAPRLPLAEHTGADPRPILRRLGLL